MNHRLMNIYCRVVESGVMARAADELEMTAAAVTKAIAELEKGLGARLLQRTTRRLQLTETGRIYYEASRRLLDQIYELHDQIGQISGSVQGRLRMSVPVSFGLTHLCEPLSRFQKLYPLVELDVCLEDRETNLFEEDFDLAIRIQRNMQDSSLIARPFGEFKILAVATKTYLAKYPSIRKPADLEGHKFLAYSLSSEPNRISFPSSKGRPSYSFKPTIKINNSLMLKQLLMLDQGIGVFPEFLVNEEIRAGKIEQLLPKYSIGLARGWVVYPSRRYTPTPVKAFAEFFTGAEKQRE